MKGVFRSGSPSQVIDSADLMDRIYTVKPEAINNDFEVEDIRLGMMVNSMVRAGVDPETAVTRARDTEVRPEERKELALQFKSRDSQDMIARHLDDFTDRPGFFAFGQRTLPPQFTGEFKALAETEYILNRGDLPLAFKVATTQMQTVWRESDVFQGEQPRMMKFAPEARHPEYSGSKALSEHLTRDLKELAPDVKMKDVRLVADLDTARTTPTSYVVFHFQPDGTTLPIFGPNGLPARFFFDHALSPEGERIVKEVEDMVSSSRKARRAQAAANAFIPALIEGKNVGEALLPLIENAGGGESRTVGETFSTGLSDIAGFIGVGE